MQKQGSGSILKVRCIDNEGFKATLEIGKIYKAQVGQFDVLGVHVDDGCYCYPNELFEIIDEQQNDLPLKLKCINNDGYPASLEVGKIYSGFEGQRGALGVIDESGEAYAYSRKRFEIVDEQSAE